MMTDQPFFDYYLYLLVCDSGLTEMVIKNSTFDICTSAMKQRSVAYDHLIIVPFY